MIAGNKPIAWLIPTDEDFSRLDAALGPKGNRVVYCYKCLGVVSTVNLVREVVKKNVLLM